MSDTPEPPPAAAAPPAPPSAAPPARASSLLIRDPVGFGALMTALAASLVGVVQTAFMWEARNDEVEAELRAQQLRACVAYDRAGAIANTEAQVAALEQLNPGDGNAAGLEDSLDAYLDATAELRYLMPKTLRPDLADAQDAALDAYAAFARRDYAKMSEISAADGPWAQHDATIQEACDSVIRTVRDR